MKVAVVGAGFAGLAAADVLASAGIEVVVLEARNRVGGRVWSRELSNGAVVEMGAEFILPGNDTIRSYVERFALGLWDKGMRYGVREPRGGVGVSAASLRDGVATIASALPSVEPGASAADVLARLPLDTGAREAITSRLEVSAAVVAERVAATELAGLAAHSDDVCPSVAGGNQQVAVALAAGLGSAVHVSTPVERVSWRPDTAVVRAGGSELAVDRVVLALPASVIDRVEFDPPLPDELRAAYGAVEYGNAAKLFVPLGADAPPSAVLSVPDRFWCWTATAGAGVQRVLNAFAGSVPALERLEVARGPETWKRLLHDLRPDLELLEDEVVLSTWDDDPWIAAAYSCWAPPQAAWAPVGPFHACGEHTHDSSRALMDGALASGVRAAQEVIDAS